MTDLPACLEIVILVFPARLTTSSTSQCVALLEIYLQDIMLFVFIDIVPYHRLTDIFFVVGPLHGREPNVILVIL